jgi:mono/diheme cytochrome c family protein
MKRIAPRLMILLPAFLLMFLLAGCGLSLAEDITPPPNYKEPAPVAQPADAQPAAASTAFPLLPPDPAQGAAIFAEKCVPCHGEKGMGDGPQAANLANPVAPLGSADLARVSRPADWYNMVTQGNLEKFMPGFASLNDRQRWDVVAYALTLSTTPQELAEGKTLYEANCVECHGVTGSADGEKAASLSVKPASWTDHERVVNLSAEDMTKVMAGGKEGHPSFESQLNETQRYAVAAYIRTLSFAKAGEPGSAAAGNEATTTANGTPDSSASAETTGTPAAVAAAPEKISITGKITNASPGGAIPAGMKITISAYQGMTPAFDVNGEVKEDGSYEVKDVQYQSDYVYFAQVEANGQTFNSDILHASDVTGAKADLPVKIYDSTTDMSKIRADRLHVFFDFSKAGTIQVVNLFIISNLGDKVVTPATPDQALINFYVPKDAQNLQFQDGEMGGRYVQTDSGFGDRMSIVPGSGQHQVLYAYDLPYTNKLSLDLKVPLAVDAVIVMVPPGGIKLKSDQLMDAGQRDVQGMSYQMYQGSSALESGGDLKLTLSGKASAGGAVPATSSLTYLYIGLGAFALALIAGGLWLYRMQKAQAPALVEDGEAAAPLVHESADSILDAIIALDDLNAAGNLPKAAYQERRADLKTRLAEALKHEQ